MFTGCNSGSDTADSKGSITTAGNGSITLGITDAPVDGAQSVTVEISAIEVHSSDGGANYNFYFCKDPNGGPSSVVTAPCSTPDTKSLDLLQLTGGVSDLLLDNEELPAGHYEWIRLTVDTATLVDGKGATYPLTIPSAAQTGLKLVSGFDVRANADVKFTIDFELRKSVHVTGNPNNPSYMLKPALRLVNNLHVGAITGTVSNSLATAVGCTPIVYVYQGASVTPDDIGSATPPISTANVNLDNATGSYKYTAAFFEAGDYTVAYTCQAAEDDPATDDNIAFIGTANVALVANSIVTRDFN
jgi:hypothetical protein